MHATFLQGILIDDDLQMMRKKRHKHLPAFQVTKSIELHSLTSLGRLSSRGNGFDFFVGRLYRTISSVEVRTYNLQVFCGVD